MSSKGAAAREITGLLQRWDEGDGGVLASIASAAYPEFRNIARGYLRVSLRLPLDPDMASVDEAVSEGLALDQALSGALDERKVQAFELRHFPGCTNEGAAGSPGVGGATVEHDLKIAKITARKELA